MFSCVVLCSVDQSCLTLCDPRDNHPPSQRPGASPDRKTRNLSVFALQGLRTVTKGAKLPSHLHRSSLTFLPLPFGVKTT